MAFKFSAHLFTASIICMFSICCRTKNNDHPGQSSQEEINSNIPQIEIKTFKTDTLSNVQNKGWGYDIYIDGKKLIHQPFIPAIPGNHGFKTEASALAVAKLAAEKIKRNIIPPTISIQELDSLNALN